MLLPVSFPRAEAEMQRARPGLWGCQVCAWECVRICESVCARPRVFLWVCAEASSSSRSPLEREPPVVSLLTWLWSSLGEGKEEAKSVCVCAGAWVVGSGWQLADAHKDSSHIFAKALAPLLPVGERNL